MKRKMKVGLIGAGWVSEYHLPAWGTQSTDAEVQAICDPDLDRARAAAGKYGIPEVFGDARQMLDQSHLDIVDICSPRETHADLVRLAVGRDLAVLCQKPMATSLQEAEKLVRDVAHHKRFMVHENWRFRPYYRKLKQWLDTGRAGDLRYVRLEFLSSGMIPGLDGKRPALVRQPMLRGLERMLIMEILIHHLDTLRYLLGEMRMIAAVRGRSNEEIIGEDIATLDLVTPTGIPVHVQGNLSVHGEGPVPKDVVHLYGSKATITLDGSTLEIAGPQPEKIVLDSAHSYAQGYSDAIGHFLECLRSGAPFETSPEDNLNTLRLVEDAYRLSGIDKLRRVG